MMFQPLESPMPRQLPDTVEQVVELLYDDLSLRDRVVMANLSENDLDSLLYATIAKPIRKEFGIYNGNTELLDSCCRYIGWKYKSYEDPVMVIIKELWKKARKTHLLHLVDTTVQVTAH
jgi:hypothetical protein